MQTAPLVPAAPQAPAGKTRRGLPRRLLRLAGWTLLVLVAAWFGFAAWVERSCLYTAPAIAADHPALALAVEDAGPGLTRCGAAWFHADEGIGELYLEGDPVTRGYCTSALCRTDMDTQEDQLLGDLDRLLPAGPRRYVVRKGLLFAFRDLPDYVDEPFQLEAAGIAAALAKGGPRPLDAEFPVFHRVLFLQSLYDIGQSMAEAGLVNTEIGCTSFAASGKATASGSLVVGRNCDFDGGAVFDDKKLVFFVAPDSGKRYVAVSWAGMIGVISGVNEDGLVLMLHAARTNETSRGPRVGRPVPMILRDALLHDSTVEEVAARFRAAPQHAAGLIVVAEAKTGRSAVIETDSSRTVVVPSQGDAIVCANQMRDASWDGDAVVETARRDGSSSLRQARIAELVAAARGRIDVTGAGEILRDRRGVGGGDVGLGNRTSVSALVAAHAIVYDAATARLHVSRAPRGLGAFVAYDLRAFFGGARPAGPADLRVPGTPEIAAAADPDSAALVAKARLLMRDADAARSDGDADAAVTAAMEAVTLTRFAPEALLCLAEALHAAGREDETRATARMALTRQPTPGVETARLRSLAGQPGE